MNKQEILATAISLTIKDKDIFYEDLLDQIFRFENINHKDIINYADQYIEGLEQYASDHYDLDY